MLRIATRKSPLALRQSQLVRDALLTVRPEQSIELVPLSTKGDRILDAPLAKVGGKGLFVKELEQALLDGRADIAVHSMKDVPVDLPAGLIISTILARHSPWDALVLPDRLDHLPAKPRIGTSSLRRQCQLQRAYPDWQLLSVRGNIHTRLAKLQAGEFDGLILAAAGLERMQLEHRIHSHLDRQICLPAMGQGAIGIECRQQDTALHEWLNQIHHPLTAACVAAERQLNRHLQGGCQVPIAGFCIERHGELHMEARVGEPDGSQLLIAEDTAPMDQAQALGQRLAHQLLHQGAGPILERWL